MLNIKSNLFLYDNIDAYCRIKLLYPFLLLIFLFYSSLSYSQKSVKVFSEGTCIGENITPSEGRKRALENARLEAIKKVVGTYITEESYRSKTESVDARSNEIYDSFSRLSLTSTAGKIINEEILYEWTKVFANSPHYITGINAEVIIEADANDPDFKAEIQLQRNVFFERESGSSDEVAFKINATKNCFIYLFNIT